MSPIAVSDAFSPSHPVIKPAKATPGAVLHHQGASPTAVSADGLYFTLEDGRRVLDATSGGAAVACIGNGNQEVIAAIGEQLQTMAFCYHQAISSSTGDKLGQFILDRSDNAFKHVGFLCSGSEAVEAALKLSRQYWLEVGEPERVYYIGREMSYHGNTLGALSVCSHLARQEPYKPIMSSSFHHVSPAYYSRYGKQAEGETEEMFSERLAEELEAKIVELGEGKVIAFFAESVVGAASCVVPPPRGYFPAISRILKKHNILLVMDEVMSGMGRLGTLHAWQSVGEGVKPDIQTIAKGLGAGYAPISGVLIGERVAKAVVEGSGQWKNSHTYQGHPTSCAAALAVQKIIFRDDLLSNNRKMGALMKSLLQESLGGLEYVFDIRGVGLFLGIEFSIPSELTLSPRFATRVKTAAFANGLIVMGLSATVDGKLGESIMLCPAYNVTEEQVREMVEILVRSIKEVYAAI